MRTFLELLQKKYGTKAAYRTIEIVDAHNEWVKSQLCDVSFKTDIKKDKYFTISNPTHKWNGRLVKSTMNRNKNGLCLVYFGSQHDYIHHSFLI